MLRKTCLVLPALISLLAAISASLPWGAPASVSLALPLMALSVIFYWGIHRGAQLPSPVVFAIGIVTDLATDGPMGFWALNFLMGYAIAYYGPRWNGERRQGLAVLALFGVAVATVSLLSWLLTSLFFLHAMPAGPLLTGAFGALVAYPVISFVLTPLDRAVGNALLYVADRQEDWL